MSDTPKADKTADSGLRLTTCCPLDREALERCATMDEGWARLYASDAIRCEQSEHPEIQKRAGNLRKRSEEYAAKAEAYREILSDNDPVEQPGPSNNP